MEAIKFKLNKETIGLKKFDKLKLRTCSPLELEETIILSKDRQDKPNNHTRKSLTHDECLSRL